MDDCIETAKLVSVLPVQIVKLHSLYIAKIQRWKSNTLRERLRSSKEEYLERVAAFLSYVRPDMVIERLFSRIPEGDACFSNWGCSWWRLRGELEELLEERNIIQGERCQYMNGAKLRLL